jgi:hypothetical protein
MPEALAAALTPARRDLLFRAAGRGTAAVRERIEGELDPPGRERRRRDAAAPPDPAQVLAVVSRFAEQARSGWIHRR